jgi:hypothetical protein
MPLPTRDKKHINTKTNIHVPSGIRTCNPSNQEAKTYASDRVATGIVTVPNEYLINTKEDQHTQNAATMQQACYKSPKREKHVR